MVSEQNCAQWAGKSFSLGSFGEVTARVPGAELGCVFPSSAMPVCRGGVASQAASGTLPPEGPADDLPLARAAQRAVLYRAFHS